MKEHKRSYSSVEEFHTRLNVFSANVKKIQQLNARSTGAHYNLTRFADMTEEEFKSFPCGVDKLSKLEGPAVEVAEMPRFFAAPPPAWDWTTKGAVTPVKDQGQCGSCWAFSSIGALEGAWFLAGHSLTSLSEQELVDCSTESYGCNGGWPFWAYTDILKGEAGRVDTETGYPYTAVTGTCSFNTAAVGATYRTYTSYCTESTSACTETQMMSLLSTKGPLSACLNATPMQFYQGGIDNPSDCDPSEIDHCITIVGYGTTNGTPFWKIKNSWGTGWGEQGYYYLQRGGGLCGINKVITLPNI